MSNPREREILALEPLRATVATLKAQHGTLLVLCQEVDGEDRPLVHKHAFLDHIFVFSEDWSKQWIQELVSLMCSFGIIEPRKCTLCTLGQGWESHWALMNVPPKLEIGAASFVLGKVVRVPVV